MLAFTQDGILFLLILELLQAEKGEEKKQER